MHEDGHVQGSDDNFGLVTSIFTLQVSPLRGLTFYGALPLARAQAFSPARPGSESESDLGNVSVGARYTLRSGPLRYGASLAVFLPTSPDFDFFGSGDGGAVFTAMALQPERLSAFAPDTTTYRTGLDLRWQGSSTFVQAELAHQPPRGPHLHLNLLSLAIAGRGRRCARMVAGWTGRHDLTAAGPAALRRRRDLVVHHQRGAAPSERESGAGSAVVPARRSSHRQ